MSDFHTYSHGNGRVDRPFAVHTARDTLIGRTDLHFPRSMSNQGECHDEKNAPVDPKSLKHAFDSEENWVSSPRKKYMYRDTKTSTARTKKGQSLIPAGGNKRECEESCRRDSECRQEEATSAGTADAVCTYTPTEEGDTYDNSSAALSRRNPHDGSSADLDVGHDALSVTSLQPRVKELWGAIVTAMEGLVARGFDRTLLFSTLPYAARHVLDPSLGLVYRRLQKRVSDSWQADEPCEVVLLCQTFIKSYEELCTIAGKSCV